MRKPMAVLVPTRSRPGNIAKVIAAWQFTGAREHADLILIADADDPAIEGYREFDPGAQGELVDLIEMPTWMPMVHKLNEIAVKLAPYYFALGFAGDDHIPQTIGWARRYVEVLRELGSGMVYGDDGYHGRKLATEWAVTSDVVREIGRMVPAPVEHLYCDNSMMDLFGGAGALRHLPEIRIEHFNPYAKGKAPMDDQYRRVNGATQYRNDRGLYLTWRESQTFPMQVAAIRSLRPGLPEERPDTEENRGARTGTPPRRVPPRSRRGETVSRHMPYPRHFRQVRGATPDEIGMALADFAAQVPADQEIVELGVFQGRTALMMAWGARQGHGAHLTGIDAWDLPGNTYGPPFNQDESRRWAAHWISSMGYNLSIKLIKAFAHEVAQHWTNPDVGRNKKVGLLFVDDDHSAEGARRAIESWAPHLAEGARIAVDDYHHPDWPGVAEAVDALVSEGFLEPVEIFHDRLAVTRLSHGGGAVVTCQEEGHDHSGSSCQGPITAITSEGVNPALQAPVATEPGCQHGDCILEHPHPGPAVLRTRRPGLAWDKAGDDDDLPSEFRDIEEVQLPEEVPSNVDSEVSTTTRSDWHMVQTGELENVEGGTSVDELNTTQLRALAKARQITLGVRKDKRSLILKALEDGR